MARARRTAPDARASGGGTFEVLGPLDVRGLAARHVRVYQPRGGAPGAGRYGLYMFDGQNVFHDAPSFAGGWQTHRAVDALARARRAAPVVIAVDHGGPARLSELSPFAFRGVAGHADRLLDWMVGTLVPYATARYGLLGGPVGAAVGGSSMGGLAALYAHFRHPEAFGGALCMSPSFWVADRALLRYVAGRPAPWTSRIYLDAGAREARGTIAATNAALAHDLAARGYTDDQLSVRVDPRGAHSESSWRRRLPSAVRFMYR